MRAAIVDERWIDHPAECLGDLPFSSTFGFFTPSIHRGKAEGRLIRAAATDAPVLRRAKCSSDHPAAIPQILRSSGSPRTGDVGSKYIARSSNSPSKLRYPQFHDRRKMMGIAHGHAMRIGVCEGMERFR